MKKTRKQELYRREKKVKKQLIAMLLVLTLSICLFPLSAFADGEPQSALHTTTSNPSITTLAVNSTPPSDFHFVYQTSGNTSVDTLINNLALNTVLFTMGFIPNAGIVSFTIAVAENLLNFYSNSPTLQGDYIKYVYRPDDPFLYPAVDSWVRIVYYADANQDGVKEYIGERSYYETIVLPKSASATA